MYILHCNISWRHKTGSKDTSTLLTWFLLFIDHLDIRFKQYYSNKIYRSTVTTLINSYMQAYTCWFIHKHVSKGGPISMSPSHCRSVFNPPFWMWRKGTGIAIALIFDMDIRNMAISKRDSCPFYKSLFSVQLYISNFTVYSSWLKPGDSIESWW